MRRLPSSAEQPDTRMGHDLSRVGMQIRVLRLNHGLTFRALAQRSGVSASMISDIERSNKIPSLAVLAALARALGTTLSDLLRDGDFARAALRIAELEPAQILNGTVSQERFAKVIAESRVVFVRLTLPPRSDTGELAPAPKGCILHAHVVGGPVEAECAGERFALRVGQILALRADNPYRYRNPSRRSVAVYLVIESPN